MEEMTKHGKVGLAAMKAGMDRKTARKYVAAGKLPSEMAVPRDWRTREDPFAEHWPEVEALVRETPALEAKTLFEVLSAKYPDRYEAGQLRTLQRRVRLWRATQGPDREVMFAQQHRPGEAAQTDFTSTSELGVTIAGQLFVHLLCVFVLPFSNWLWATVCLSESMAALRKGVQRALFQLGRVPRYHQTDNSTAATHRIPDGKKVFYEDGKRPFNDDYLALMRHFGMTPRTTAIGAKEQNGDVESENGAIKRRLEQLLLVRGSRDFEDVAAWQAFIDDVLRKANAGRRTRVGEDLAAMRELNVAKLPEYVEEDVMVSAWSTMRVKHCAYSVPSRLMGEMVRVHVYDARIEVYFGEPCSSRASDSSGTGFASHRLPARDLVARCESPPPSRGTSTARRCFPRSSSAERTTRSRRRSTAPQATSSTCASFIWQRARWSPTSRRPCRSCSWQREGDSERSRQGDGQQADRVRGSRARVARRRPGRVRRARLGGRHMSADASGTHAGLRRSCSAH